MITLKDIFPCTIAEILNSKAITPTFLECKPQKPPKTTLKPGTQALEITLYPYLKETKC